MRLPATQAGKLTLPIPPHVIQRSEQTLDVGFIVVEMEGDANPSVATPDEDAALRQCMDERRGFRPREADVRPAPVGRFRRQKSQAAIIEGPPQFATEREDMSLDPLNADTFQIRERIVEDGECHKRRVARLEAGRVRCQLVRSRMRDAARR